MGTAVYLIGAGPGDPELITLKGRRCLELVDCVIYDYLVNRELLDYVQAKAERIYVGKQGGQDYISQEKITALILQRAREGKQVARLKGGDPFIFARGGEEAEALAQAGISFEVIPGISAGSAAPTYAGIPLTHRGYSPTVAFITAHQDPTQEVSPIAWDQLSQRDGTLVFFMGAGSLNEVVQQLTHQGRSPETPIALIRWGTYPKQQVITGTLGSILDHAKNLASPTIIVVGEVVKLRERLRWFDNRPLFGKTILITRPLEQIEDFKHQLHVLGATVIPFPTLEVLDPSSWAPLDRAIQKIDQYDWVIFTSTNSVKHFFIRYFRIHSDIRELKNIKIATIGPATAKAVRTLNISIDTLPMDYRAEGLVESLRGKVLKGTRVLIPRAKIAREVLPQKLHQQGAQVEVVEAYQTGIPKSSYSGWCQILEQQPPHMVVFTSSSTVSNLATIIYPQSLPKNLQHVSVACIGPITAKTAETLGLKVSVVPKRYTTAALVDAITTYFCQTQL